MSRPLNVSELDWLKSECERLQSRGDKTEELRSLLHGLYDLYVQCEEYQPDNPLVHNVQRELGII